MINRRVLIRRVVESVIRNEAEEQGELICVGGGGRSDICIEEKRKRKELHVAFIYFEKARM